MNTNRIRALLFKHLTLWRRDYDRLVDTFWWPLLDLIIWGFVTVYLMKQENADYNAVVFFIGAVVLWGIINRSQLDISWLFLQETWDRNIAGLFGSPLTIGEFMVASIIHGIVKLTISLAVVSLFAFILFAFNITSFGWYLVPFIANLLIMGWWIGFIVVGLILRFGQRVQAFAWSTVFFFQPISAVFYPVSVLPPFVRAIAWTSPATYVFEGMRSVLTGGVMDVRLLVFATLLNAVYLAASLIFFRRMFFSFRDRGLIKHFT